MSHRIQSVALSTGVTLPYVEQGDPGGAPVVLLHGYSDSWRSWELLLAELSDDVHAFAITQRGHGDADRPADGYQPCDLANDAVAFMDAVGIRAAVVAGHSGGSYTAQRMAIDHPDRTLGLVLIGALHTLRDNAAAKELWDAVSDQRTGHAPHWERPQQVAAELAAFSASVTGTTVKFRRAEAADEPFLEDMLRLAAGWREGVPAALTADIEKYVRGYGRGGDHGIVVLAGGMPVGAAWYRYLTGAMRGYGYVADDIPELSLAVQPHARRRGLGTGLVVRLLADAALQRLPGLSLSVEADNPARQLYERLGFVRVGDPGTVWTMLRRTTP